MYIFCFKKVQTKLEIVHQITRRKELSAQWIPKPFYGFYLCLFVLISAKEIQNG